MWWCKQRAAWGRLARLAVVLAAAGLTAGCFQPLYGTQPSAETDSVRDKLAQVDVPVIPAPKGQSAARVAVALRNSLQYGLNGAAAGPTPVWDEVAATTSRIDRSINTFKRVDRKDAAHDPDAEN